MIRSPPFCYITTTWSTNTFRKKYILAVVFYTEYVDTEIKLKHRNHAYTHTAFHGNSLLINSLCLLLLNSDWHISSLFLKFCYLRRRILMTKHFYQIIKYIKLLTLDNSTIITTEQNVPSSKIVCTKRITISINKTKGAYILTQYILLNQRKSSLNQWNSVTNGDQ